jgi:hypothetical protein
MPLSCDCYVLSGKVVCDGLIRRVLAIVMCLSVFEGLYRGGQGPLGLLTNENKSKEFYKMRQLYLERCVLRCDT